jgi:hypothetical protein
VCGGGGGSARLSVCLFVIRAPGVHIPPTKLTAVKVREGDGGATRALRVATVWLRHAPIDCHRDETLITSFKNMVDLAGEPTSGSFLFQAFG